MAAVAATVQVQSLGTVCVQGSSSRLLGGKPLCLAPLPSTATRGVSLVVRAGSGLPSPTKDSNRALIFASKQSLSYLDGRYRLPLPLKALLCDTFKDSNIIYPCSNQVAESSDLSSWLDFLTITSSSCQSVFKQLMGTPVQPLLPTSTSSPCVSRISFHCLVQSLVCPFFILSYPQQEGFQIIFYFQTCLLSLTSCIKTKTQL